MVTARTDVDVSTVTPGISNDWKKFAPGIAPGEPVATRLNPLLPHAAPALAFFRLCTTNQPKGRE